MKPVRLARWAAVFAILAGSGIVGMVWGLSASAASPAAAARTGSSVNQTAEDVSENLPKLTVHGIQASTVTISSPGTYTPHAAPGTYDDYHCTLLNPHIKTNSFIVASQFYPESKEVHHSILFLVPPNEAATAEAANKNGKGWSCFGEAPIPGSSSLGFGGAPWLAAWAPGAPENVEPPGTGVPFPAGSLVIEQIHYNLLIGDKPVNTKLQLQVVPATVPLQPLNLGLYVAPPDVPCPAGVTGPLCNRNASIAYSAKEFGPSIVSLINTMESFCGRNPSDPPSSDTTTCTWPAGQTGYIVRMTAHMHLLGVSMRVILNPGTPDSKVLLDVPNYDFNYQRSYNLAKPVYVTAHDRIQVSCTYNPKLRQEIPYLRNLAPQYITWGWGSADEMCLALAEFAPA